ncbi:MAG: HAD family hydrolase [Bacteroidota bacterium]
MIEKYKHVIWDWNGTIFNDVQLGVDIVNKMLLPRKLPTLTVETYRDTFTIPVKNYYERIGFDFSKESFEMLGKHWMDEYESRKFECGLYKGVVDLMEKISSHGIGQSILSAYSQHTLEEMVDHYGLRKYFHHIVGLDNIYAAGKLHLGIELMNRLGNARPAGSKLGKGETLLIGDTVHDYEVASEIGADCVLIANGHQSKKILEKCGVPVFNNIKEIV